MDNNVLPNINKALGGQFRFMFAKATNWHTIVIQTPTDSDSCADLHFDNEIRNGLQKIGIIVTEITANSKMSRFLIDGITRDVGKDLGSGSNETADQIASNYPDIELAQVPVWMC